MRKTLVEVLSIIFIVFPKLFTPLLLFIIVLVFTDYTPSIDDVFFVSILQFLWWILLGLFNININIGAGEDD